MYGQSTNIRAGDGLVSVIFPRFIEKHRSRRELVIIIPPIPLIFLLPLKVYLVLRNVLNPWKARYLEILKYLRRCLKCDALIDTAQSFRAHANIFEVIMISVAQDNSQSSNIKEWLDVKLTFTIKPCHITSVSLFIC